MIISDKRCLNQFINPHKYKMVKRLLWKLQEDRILKQLFEKHNIKKWSKISKILQKQYGIKGRTGKKCRQRYKNHLAQDFKKLPWTKSQINKLIELHCQFGSRWAQISNEMDGRSNNSVKSMFYSKLRSSINGINKIIGKFFSKQTKLIQIKSIYWLIEVTDGYLYSNHEMTQIVKQSFDLKKQLLYLDTPFKKQLLQPNREKFEAIIDSINIFLNNHKRVRGNQRNQIKKSFFDNSNSLANDQLPVKPQKTYQEIINVSTKYNTFNKVIKPSNDSKPFFFQEEQSFLEKPIAVENVLSQKISTSYKRRQIMAWPSTWTHLQQFDQDESQ